MKKNRMLKRIKSAGDKRILTRFFNFRSFVLVFFILMICIDAQLLGDGEEVDNTGAAFITIDPFPRSSGMGSSCTGLSDGITSLYFNPGGLSLSKGDIISATHCEWFQGMRFENLALSRNMGNRGTLGANVKGFYTGGMEKRSSDVPHPESSFGAYFLDFGITYSKRFFYCLPIGFSVRGIYESIDEYTAVGGCLDFGLVYLTGIDGLQIGVSAKNIGSDMKFREEEFKLPSSIRIGAGYTTMGDNLIITTDMFKRGKDDAVVNIGGEFTILNTLCLRMGLNGETRKDIGDAAGISAGAGFTIGDIIIDYGFVNYDYLGMTHRFGISFTPGVTSEERKRIQQLAIEEARKSLEEKEKMMSSMYLKQGKEFFAKGLYDEAISNLDISIVWNPENSEAKKFINSVKEEKEQEELKEILREGKEALGDGNYLEANAKFDKVLKIDPGNKEASALRNQAREEMEKKTAVFARKKREGEDIQSIFNSAVKNYTNGNYKTAISGWQKVLSIDASREDARSYIRKAEIKLEEEINRLEKEIRDKESKGDWLGVLSIVAQLNLIDAKNEVGIEAKERALEKIENIKQTNLKEAKQFYSQGDMFSAEEHFRIVLQYDAGNKEAKSYISKIEGKGKEKDADKWYLKGIDAYTNHNYKLAISYWERCLEIDPGYEKAKKNIERARKKLIELGEVE